MARIRVAIQSNVVSSERIDAVLSETSAIRAEAGCIQFELFKSIEFPEDFVQLELWESEAAYDAHWQRVRKNPVTGGILADGSGRLSAPYHHGMLEAPRREGESGIEIYPHALFARAGDVWVRADETARIKSVRWPARSAVRIVIQLNMPVESEAAAIQNSLDTRKEPGCLQFEQFRSIHFPENTVLMELWASPEIYDVHYLKRIEDRIFGGATPPAAPATPPERRYGQRGFEWYQHTFLTEIDGVWQPETVGERMVTVRW